MGSQITKCKDRQTDLIDGFLYPIAYAMRRLFAYLEGIY